MEIKYAYIITYLGVSVLGSILYGETEFFCSKSMIDSFELREKVKKEIYKLLPNVNEHLTLKEFNLVSVERMPQNDRYQKEE